MSRKYLGYSITRFELAKIPGQIHRHILVILGKKSSIIELNNMVFKEKHDVKKQA
jgi:hypothetical protein